ncbi:hypothetical protein EUX98_g8132, partial [Antrodiella citrinella]
PRPTLTTPLLTPLRGVLLLEYPIVGHGEAFLIDFSWAGKAGFAKYPRSLSSSISLRSTTPERHDRGGYIIGASDMFKRARVQSGHLNIDHDHAHSTNHPTRFSPHLQSNNNSSSQKDSMGRSTKNSAKSRQIVEPEPVVEAEDDVDVNCFFFSEHNSDHITFTLNIARSKFTKPLESLLEDVATKLIRHYKFDSDISTIRFYTLKTPLQAEDVDEDWVGSVDNIKAIAKFRQPTTRIKTILGAVESFDEEALHLLITAEEDMTV